MYTQEEINLIILSSFKELTYSLKRRLLSEDNYENKKRLLIKTLPCGVYNKIESNFSNPAYREEVLRGLEEKSIKCVTYFSDGYPQTLRNIYEPPVVLYCRGDTSLLKSNCFSVVGSRRTSPKYIAECKKISGEISEVFTVVTGIAEGADTAALEGALAAGGKVISVLAYGFDFVYPACNAQLLNRIESEGLVITEHLRDIQPAPYLFPFRNRIIAGLSRGTLVVSGGIKSGALITANYAMEYDRDLFVFPYSIGVAGGAGCNFLLKKCGQLTENILDIYNAYGLDFNTHAPVELTETEAAVYEEVKKRGEAFLADVANSLKKYPYEITPVMTSLQIKGLVANLGGNRYSALNR